MVAVPLNTKIKLQRAKNMEQLENFIEYRRFLDKAQRLLADARDRLQIVDVKLTDKEKKEAKNCDRYNLPSVIAGLEGYVLRKSLSCDSSRYIQQSELAPIADEYDDIDQIYDYVRGFAPLPKNLNRFETKIDSPPPPLLHKQIITNEKSQPDSGNYSFVKTNNNSNTNNNNTIESKKNSNNHHIHHHHHNHTSHYGHVHNNTSAVIAENDMENGKPIPPPIETIPGKKIPEKRQRPTLPKLYVKNTTSNQHQKISNANSPIIINANKEVHEPQSPLFHIR